MDVKVSPVMHAAADPAQSPASATAISLAPQESSATRYSYAVLALLLAASFLYYTHAFWVPAHPGVDQNGYLVGGEMLAQHGSPSLQPINPITGKIDPYLFVGEMWIGADIGTPHERYYPKYPIGLPAIYAILLKLGGAKFGWWLCFWVDPVLMTLAVAGTFFFIRAIVGSLPAFLGALIMATSPVTIGLTNDANSHAGAACCAVWGMFFLLNWWRRGGLRWAIPAGFVAGYTCTIRYTEGLLVLPIGLVILYRFFSVARNRRLLLESTAALAFWALPITIMVIFNLNAFGSLTGYAPTNESEGFSFQYFLDNWPTVLHHLNDTGLFFIFPLALIGIALMFARTWRTALFLATWALPSLIVYALYYWAPDGTNIGYLRFFLTLFPALITGAIWLVFNVLGAPRRPRSTALLAGAITAACVLVNTDLGIPSLENQHRGNLMFLRGSDEIMGFANVPGAVPSGSVLFGPPPMLHYLQFRDPHYILYNDTLFLPGAAARFRDPDPNDPQPFQPQRAEALYNIFKDFSDADMIGEEKRVIDQALDANRRVFFFTSFRQLMVLRRRLAVGSNKPGAEVFDLTEVATWNDPNAAQMPASRVGLPPKPRRHPIQPIVIDPRDTMNIVVEVHRGIRPTPPRPTPPPRLIGPRRPARKTPARPATQPAI